VRLGMVGLGRMGAGMARRLLRAGHEVVVHDLSRDAMAALVADGAEARDSVDAVVDALEAPRVVWVMVPAGRPTDTAIRTAAARMDAGDVVIDGGNSDHRDTITRSAALLDDGVHLLDVGTSGGVWGLDEGYCLMAGGDPQAYALAEPALASLATDGGLAHVGPTGSGHYVKMVHNGVEYGLMQAYAEGFELLRSGPFDVDEAGVAELWRHGSVVRSWLLDLASRALREDPGLERLAGYVEDSGEGRWTVETALQHAVPVPAISAALFARFASRRQDTFGNRMLAALRQQFGGHATRDVEPVREEDRA